MLWGVMQVESGGDVEEGENVKLWKWRREGGWSEGGALSVRVVEWESRNECWCSVCSVAWVLSVLEGAVKQAVICTTLY